MAPTRRPETEPTRRSERQQVAHAIKVSDYEAKLKSGIIKPKRFHRPRQRKSCLLLNKLPGEIRNRIYHFALVEPERIEVKTAGPGEPSLLRVCKAVRNEASSIYYLENLFRINVDDWNGAEFTPFARQYRPFEYMKAIRTFRKDLHPQKINNKSEIVFQLAGKPSWDNLIKWIKEEHTGYTMLPDMEPLETPDDHVVAGALRLAKMLRFGPWSRVEEALAAYRLGIKGTWSPWADDL